MITAINSPAFHQRQYTSVKDAWKHGFNENFWRWGLVFNQGNEMNVSQRRAEARANFIASRLLRRIYGNRFRQKKAEIRLIAFEHGKSECCNRHYHFLMAIDGVELSWSDDQVAQAIEEIDLEFITKTGRSEKPVYVDYDWKNGNRYHSYVSRYVQNGSSANWFFIEKNNARRSRKRIRSH